MKKTYFAPETTVVKMVAQPILNIASNGDGTQNAGGNQGDLSDTDVVLSRHASLWDDDEEE